MRLNQEFVPAVLTANKASKTHEFGSKTRRLIENPPKLRKFRVPNSLFCYQLAACRKSPEPLHSGIKNALNWCFLSLNGGFLSRFWLLIIVLRQPASSLYCGRWLRWQGRIIFISRFLCVGMVSGVAVWHLELCFVVDHGTFSGGKAVVFAEKPRPQPMSRVKRA
jgi:hypothetical protein